MPLDDFRRDRDEPVRHFKIRRGIITLLLWRPLTAQLRHEFAQGFDTFAARNRELFCLIT